MIFFYCYFGKDVGVFIGILFFIYCFKMSLFSLFYLFTLVLGIILFFQHLFKSFKDCLVVIFLPLFSFHI